jgi:hypothetical protein
VAYATVQDVVDTGLAPAVDAGKVQDALNLAQNLIDGFCRQSFELSPSGTVKAFNGRGHGSIYFGNQHLTVVEDIKVDGISILVGLDYKNHGNYLEATNQVFPYGSNNVEITGQWGRYPQVMPVIKKAALELALDELVPSRREQAVITEKQVGDTRIRRAVAQFSGIANRYMSTGNTRVDDWLRPYVKVAVGIGAVGGRRNLAFSEATNYGRSDVRR